MHSPSPEAPLTAAEVTRRAWLRGGLAVGTYPFFCLLHQAQGMTGKVTVVH